MRLGRLLNKRRVTKCHPISLSQFPQELRACRDIVHAEKNNCWLTVCKVFLFLMKLYKYRSTYVLLSEIGVPSPYHAIWDQCAHIGHNSIHPEASLLFRNYYVYRSPVLYLRLFGFSYHVYPHSIYIQIVSKPTHANITMVIKIAPKKKHNISFMDSFIASSSLFLTLLYLIFTTLSSGF